MSNNPSLPQNFLRFCPHCGNAAFRSVSPKEFVCDAAAGGCGFRFFTNSAAAVAAIIEDGQGRILLSRRAVEPWKGSLDLPGGFVDPGESLEEALRRELEEELGAEIENTEYLCSFPNRYIFSGYEVSTTDAAFVCRLRQTQLCPTDDIDCIEWHEVNNIPLDRIQSESIRNILLFYQKTIVHSPKC